MRRRMTPPKSVRAVPPSRRRSHRWGSLRARSAPVGCARGGWFTSQPELTYGFPHRGLDKFYGFFSGSFSRDEREIVSRFVVTVSTFLIIVSRFVKSYMGVARPRLLKARMCRLKAQYELRDGDPLSDQLDVPESSGGHR